MGMRTGADTAGGARAGGADAPSVLAVDAGNSKTDVAVVTAGGRVLGTARGRASGRPPWASGRRWTPSPCP